MLEFCRARWRRRGRQQRARGRSRRPKGRADDQRAQGGECDCPASASNL